MASVSSLDKDVRKLRLSRYTPQAANEIRAWIEGALGERLAGGDLLEALKDGIALCKLANLAAPPGVRFKESSMPFVQMENISHFLRACQQAPISLHSHDVFQTVDLYESKDPAQVLQCIAAFSRRAHSLQPGRFPSAIGAETSKPSVMSPQGTGSGAASRFGRPRGTSNTSEASSNASHSQSLGGRTSPTKAFEGAAFRNVNGGVSSPAGGVSSWSKKADEGATAPAWNIHQYGYMGGASQGNQGVAFGARRQITTQAPHVPSLAEKERKRREQEVEKERLRQEADETERTRQLEREANEERKRAEEESRWAEETRKQREVEKRQIEEEKRKWAEEEKRWKDEEETRMREEQESEAQAKSQSKQLGVTEASRPNLQGQFLSDYQAEQQRISNGEISVASTDRERVKELERQLEEAKRREAQYERERQERPSRDQHRDQSPVRPQDSLREEQIQTQVPANMIPYGSHMNHDDGGVESERSLLQQAWQATNPDPEPPAKPPRPLPIPQASEVPPPKPPRPLPTPQASSNHIPIMKPPSPSPSPSPPPPALPSRPLPDPAAYRQPRASPSPSRKSPFTRPTATPSPPPPATETAPPPRSGTSGPPSSSAGGQSFRKPPSSLLAREMELDRQRQEEWAESQAATATRKPDPSNSANAADRGLGGGAWDVHQYGYMGGDSQNRGNVGIGGFGGARRQLVGGPRNMPSRSNAEGEGSEK